MFKIFRLDCKSLSPFWVLPISLKAASNFFISPNKADHPMTAWSVAVFCAFNVSVAFFAPILSIASEALVIIVDRFLTEFSTV